MSEKSYCVTFSVDRTPDEVFAAINDVRKWWSGEITGPTDQLGGEFVYRHGDVHRSTQKVTELVPGKRVVWRVTDANLSFAHDKREWIGTDIVFDIARKNGKTVVQFTHHGLLPTFDCYDACSTGWNAFANENLRAFIDTGEKQPDPFA